MSASRRLRALLAVAFTGFAATAMGLVAAPDAFAVTKLTQSQAQSQLGSHGITHSSSGNCTMRSNPTCTSYEQINQSTVSGAITLKGASACSINITGGTEVGH